MVDNLQRDQLVLDLDGVRHSGWTGLSLIRSIERGPSEFDLQLTERWHPAQDGQPHTTTPRTVRVGMACRIWLDDALLLTGYLDDVDPEYDSTNHRIRARGRSKLGDLVDCSTVGQQFKGISLRAIATQLLEPFGIQVQVDSAVTAEASAPFRSESIDSGQPVWEFLEQLARMRAVLLVSDSQGNLVITRAGTTMADTALVQGQNILSASGKFSHRDRFSEYRVLGQQPYQSGFGTGDTVKPFGTAMGDGRYRPRVMISDNAADIAACKNRAEWQRNVDWGRSRGVVYTVAGWRQKPGGRVWRPNERVHVQDAWAGIDTDKTGPLLITETRLKLTKERGRHTELRLMPPEAFELLPLPETPSDDTEGFH